MSFCLCPIKNDYKFKEHNYSLKKEKLVSNAKNQLQGLIRANKNKLKALARANKNKAVTKNSNGNGGTWK